VWASSQFHSRQVQSGKASAAPSSSTNGNRSLGRNGGINPAHQRLIDGRLLNVVILLMLTTSVLGPVLTERFTPRIFADLKPAQAA